MTPGTRYHTPHGLLTIDRICVGGVLVSPPVRINGRLTRWLARLGVEEAVRRGEWVAV